MQRGRERGARGAKGERASVSKGLHVSEIHNN